MSAGGRRPGVLAGGSVVVAALSSACCWFPLLAVGVGSSAVGFGTVFERYRGPLLALAVGLLVVAVIVQRRIGRACDGGACPPRRRSGLMFPIVGGLLVLAFALAPEVLAWVHDDEPKITTTHASGDIAETYAVTGMTCEGCSSMLANYLEEQPEIQSATVDYGSATVQISFAPGTSAPDEVVQRVADEWDTYNFERLQQREIETPRG